MLYTFRAPLVLDVSTYGSLGVGVSADGTVAAAAALGRLVPGERETVPGDLLLLDAIYTEGHTRVPLAPPLAVWIGPGHIVAAQILVDRPVRDRSVA
jgi:hypothetical protein